MPAESNLGLMSEKANTYDAPSAELRFVLRNAPVALVPGTNILSPDAPRAQRILQQKWAIYHHPPGDPEHHYKREVEWRDVPLVEEAVDASR